MTPNRLEMQPLDGAERPSFLPVTEPSPELQEHLIDSDSPADAARRRRGTPRSKIRELLKAVSIVGSLIVFLVLLEALAPAAAL